MPREKRKSTELNEPNETKKRLKHYSVHISKNVAQSLQEQIRAHDKEANDFKTASIDKKKSTKSKSKTRKIDFDKIHQKQFEKMEDIGTATKKKEDRIQKLFESFFSSNDTKKKESKSKKIDDAKDGKENVSSNIAKSSKKSSKSKGLLRSKKKDVESDAKLSSLRPVSPIQKKKSLIRTRSMSSLASMPMRSTKLTLVKPFNLSTSNRKTRENNLISSSSTIQHATPSKSISRSGSKIMKKSPTKVKPFKLRTAQDDDASFIEFSSSVC